MSLTSSVCLTLLLSGGPQMGQITPAEESAAAEWLKTQNVSHPSKTLIQETLKNWQVWRTTTSTARDANLGLELKNLAPESEAQILSFSGRKQLEEVSAKNLARLKNQLLTRIALPTEPAKATANRVDAMTTNIAFHYLTRDKQTKETGARGPLPSPRELKKLNLNFAPSFYSDLVGTSTGVAFTIIATKAKMSPYSINAQVPFDALRLSDDLAEDAGYVLPNFSNALSLISFFSDWEPELIPKLIRQNRMSLPFEIKTPEQFHRYLDPSRIDETFPDDKIYERMSVLRERLIDYVLTEKDSRELLSWAFARWLAAVAQREPQEFARIEREFTLAAGPQNVFAKKFLPELGLPDLTLRVPLAVGPQSYSILRIENIAYNPFPDYTRKPQPPWDSRRLDHDSKP